MAEKKSMKVLRDEAEKALATGITNKEQLFESLPQLIALQKAVENHKMLVKQGDEVVKKLAEACGKYALAHQSVFDTDVVKHPNGAMSGNITLDDVTYILKNTLGEVKREHGEMFTQDFLAKLPKEWTKQKLEKNFANVSDADLEAWEIKRTRKNTWEEAENI